MHQQDQPTPSPTPATTPPAPAVCVVVDHGRQDALAIRLAEALGTVVIDGDLLHPGGRRSGRSYDRDRWDWLSEIGRTLHATDGRGAVVTCTGLTFRCREVIRWEAPRAVFVRSHHDGPAAEPDLLRAADLLGPADDVRSAPGALADLRGVLAKERTA